MINADPYVYPGTDVLQNSYDIRDARQLEEIETGITMNAMRIPLGKVEISPAGYCTIHRHVFQPIYPWAGEYRTCQLGKPFWFEEPKNIAARMQEQFTRINAENNLKGLKRREFAERAAEHLCELNDIHPFREGNGRTNRLFAQALAAQAGHKLHIEQIDQKAWMEASIAGFHRSDYEPMTRVIEQAFRSQSKELGISR